MSARALSFRTMNLGGRLKLAREYREKTQQQLADLTPGANQPMISALEKRDSETTTLLFAFADALHVSPRWLLTGIGESGLEKPIPAKKKDPFLEQLLELWHGLSADSKDQLLSNANWLYAREHPDASTKNPFGKGNTIPTGSKPTAPSKSS